MMQKRNFALMSDSELVKGLTAFPTNDKLHEYFFNNKCKRLLTYISATLYKDAPCGELVGEFYEYLSNDDWKVLRMWEGKNGCSLNSYLSQCSLRYFTGRVNAEKRRNAFEVMPSTPEVIELLDRFTVEDEADMPPVWDAYRMLKVRDQVILRLLVIEGKEMMDAAPEIWPYMNSAHQLYELPQKNVQSAIAMAKHRALLALMNCLNKLIRN